MSYTGNRVGGFIVNSAQIQDGSIQYSDFSAPVQTMLGQGFRNRLINGNFDIWQRGTSFTNPASAAASYCADRWQAYRSALATGISVFQAGSIAAGSRYGLQLVRAASDTNTQSMFVSTSFETIDVIKLQGQQITVSWLAVANAAGAFNGASLGFQATYGTGTDGNLATGFTGQTTVPGSAKSVVLSTSATRYSVTCTVPANATQLGISFSLNPTGTAGSSGQDWIILAQVQLEPGTVVTGFEYRPTQTELALCQRYYEPIGAYWQGNTTSGNGYGGTIYYKVAKRTTPTLATISQANLNGSFSTATSGNVGGMETLFCTYVASSTSTTNGAAYSITSAAIAEL